MGYFGQKGLCEIDRTPQEEQPKKERRKYSQDAFSKSRTVEYHLRFRSQCVPSAVR